MLAKNEQGNQPTYYSSIMADDLVYNSRGKIQQLRTTYYSGKNLKPKL